MRSITFEEAITELEGIVEKMEQGDLTLEESVKYYKKGIEYASFCSKKLEEVEKQVQVIRESKDGYQITDLDT